MAEHKYEKFTEKEDVVVEGIDISGVWKGCMNLGSFEYDLPLHGQGHRNSKARNRWVGVINVPNV